MKTKQFLSIYNQNLKTVIRNKSVMIISIIALIAIIAAPFILSKLVVVGTINDNWKELKVINFVMASIKYALFGILIVLAINYMYGKQSRSGLHNLELRFGIKIYQIYFIRYLILATVVLTIYLFDVGYSAIVFYVADIVSPILLNNIVMMNYVYLLFFLLFFSSITLLIYSFSKKIMAILLAMIFMIFMLGAPFLNLINQSVLASDYETTLKLQKEARVNSRIWYGKKWIEFTDKNVDEKAKWNDLLSEIQDSENNVTLTNALRSGNLISKGSDFIEMFENYKTWMNLYNFQKNINDVFENTTNKTVDDSLFSTQKYSYNVHKYNIKENIDFLLNSGKVEEYRNVLEFLALYGDEIKLYNEISDRYTQGQDSFGGEIFKYKRNNPETQNIFNNYVVKEIMWLLASFIIYSQTLDNEVIEVLQDNFETTKANKNSLWFNPMSHFNTMFNVGKSKNAHLTNIYNISQKTLGSFNNMYYDVQLTEKLQHYSTDLYSPEHIIYDLLDTKDLLKSINPIERKVVSTSGLYAAYTTIAILMTGLSFGVFYWRRK